jgi:hypothetical protein
MEKEKEMCGPFSGYFLCNKVCVILALNIVGVLLLASIGLLIGLGLTKLSPKNIGSTCTSNSECLALSNYGLICNNGNCTCKDSAFYYGSNCCNSTVIFFFKFFIFTHCLLSKIERLLIQLPVKFRM